MSVVTLIGAGQMASALTFPLFENGHEVRLVGSPLDDAVIGRLREDGYHVNLLRTLHEGIRYYMDSEREQALKGADLVVCGVSSFGVDWFADTVLPKLKKDVPVISVTKGMLDFPDGRMMTYPEYWREKVPDGPELYAIGGPCTARDLADHDPSFVGYCGPDMKKLRWIRSLFATEYYLISLTRDVVGLECAVALKNGYALGTALAIDEVMEQLKGQTLEAVVIATRTARAVKALAKDGKVKESDFPLLMHVNALLNEGAALQIPWKDFQKEM